MTSKTLAGGAGGGGGGGGLPALVGGVTGGATLDEETFSMHQVEEFQIWSYMLGQLFGWP